VFGFPRCDRVFAAGLVLPATKTVTRRRQRLTNAPLGCYNAADFGKEGALRYE